MSTTTNTNTFHALAEAKGKLSMAETALNNARNMNTAQFGESFVVKRINEAQQSIERWTAEIERLETAGVSNNTPVSVVSHEVSEKAKRKAAKKAAKRQNLLRGNAQLPSRAVGNRRTPRLTQAEIREQQLARELERFESFTLKSQLQKKLERMPSNQGLHIGGILHIGQAAVEGDPNSFSYTKRETIDGESKVYEYVTSRSADGYTRETKYHRGVQVGEPVFRRSPFRKLPVPQPEYTATAEDFPVLERAKVIPRDPAARKYRSFAAALTLDTASEPVVEQPEQETAESVEAPSTPRNQPTTPVPPNAPRKQRKQPEPEPEPEDDGFTTVARGTRQRKIELTPAMAARVEQMPENVGMFVRGKIFWGKQRKTPHNTKMATKLGKNGDQDGVLRYTWNSRCYRVHFKARGSKDWIQLENRRTNGERIMSSVC